MSIGMTPEGMRKMFRIEALVIAGRPVLITLPITVLFVWFMITASYLNPIEFFVSGSHCSYRNFYRSNFWICCTGILCRGQKNPEMQPSRSTTK